ncbi:MAG: hypothetical protein WCH11_03770 [Bdellovibrio sp.]
MAKIEEFKNRKPKRQSSKKRSSPGAQSSVPEESLSLMESPPSPDRGLGSSEYRRPGRDGEVPPLQSVEVEGPSPESSRDPSQESTFTSKEDSSPGAQASSTSDAQTEGPPKERIELSFYGSELLRAGFPKAFQIADEVATDWVQGGAFDSLPVDNLLVKSLAQQGLLKAKDLETKVLQSPVNEKVVTRAFEVGMEASKILDKLKSRFRGE